jgi:hypothetical protein
MTLGRIHTAVFQLSPLLLVVSSLFAASLNELMGILSWEQSLPVRLTILVATTLWLLMLLAPIHRLGYCCLEG